MRYEVKFAYPPHFEDQVYQWLRGHPCAFAEAYPERRVQNVYFDTYDLEAFGENLAGISRRSKVRFRWYGADSLPTAGTLEIKNKRAELGWKDSVRLPIAPYQAGDSWRDVHRAICAAIPASLRMILDDHPQAALINRYTRRYYESHDRLLRVTLDSDQVMFDQTSSRQPNVRRAINLPEVHVLELKCEAEHRRLAAQALGSCPVRGSRFSKYTVGVELRG